MRFKKITRQKLCCSRLGWEVSLLLLPDIWGLDVAAVGSSSAGYQECKH